MEQINIVRYEITAQGPLDEFEEMVHQLELKYSSDHLAMAGLHEDEISCAISRGMHICQLNEVDARDHFRCLFLFDEASGTLVCDWRMSRQGFMLAIMNAPHCNPAVAHWQWELINSRIS